MCYTCAGYVAKSMDLKTSFWDGKDLFGITLVAQMKRTSLTFFYLYLNNKQKINHALTLIHLADHPHEVVLQVYPDILGEPPECDSPELRCLVL